MRVRGLRVWVPLAVAAVIAASCTSEPDAALPTVELSTTSVTTLPPTTRAPTTTEAPTTTLDPRIAEVEAAVAGLRTAQVLVLVDASAEVAQLSDFAEGSFLDSLIDNTLKARAEGRRFEGAFDSVLVETTSTSELEMVVVECGHDRVAVVDSAGTTLVPADLVPVLRLVTVRFIADLEGWRVSGIEFAGQERQSCEL